ncbi:hypothetical protein LU631_10735 [Erwinia tracheiphila]|nr:hypothetical protein [Erwinia tracheiphila]UIA89590.1 hypothetical protein LU631_10735 [Erwinia tracheiphila]UIA98338.1 hypothetical protein LU633_11790 [Erwinia tracheiphila]
MIAQKNHPLKRIILAAKLARINLIERHVVALADSLPPAPAESLFPA